MLSTLLGLFGCAKRQTIHTGTFSNETYALKAIDIQGFSTNSIEYELVLGRWKPIHIDAITTNWGAPYADDLYGDTRRVYISPTHIAYRNEPDNFVDHQATMLYLSPSRFSSDAFAHIARFMQTEWPTIDRKFANERYSRFPHIIGLVYSESDAFRRVFKGQGTDANKAITVEVDGRVRYGAVDLSFEEGSGLSDKVQMPGKIIYVATGKNAGLTLAQVRTYKDKAGKTLFDYFQLQEKP
ncbi:hypothetical protein [Fibrella aquatilis]|uniref:Uncharacterized protein n=1 Tax=Fibrella aquatilis TaxID=2817059 RepID=A0A939JXX6_9BACT|nr:hypothetical protein [Fibrella aquatilis]MBO0929753.1 hypothetical protein [Fibrella aquatilis]